MLHYLSSGGAKIIHIITCEARIAYTTTTSSGSGIGTMGVLDANKSKSIYTMASRAPLYNINNYVTYPHTMNEFCPADQAILLLLLASHSTICRDAYGSYYAL